MTSSRISGAHGPDEGAGSAPEGMPGQAPVAESGEPDSAPRTPSRETDWVFAASNGFAHRVGDAAELHQLLAAALQAPRSAGLEWIQVQHAVETHVYVAFDVADGSDASADGAADPSDPVAADSAATEPATDTDSAQQKWRVSADESTRPAMGDATGGALTPDEAAQLARRLL